MAARLRAQTSRQACISAREYATTRPAAIRLNYGLNRHAGGGMAVRTVACLPAVVGAWRDVGGGALLSTSGTFPVDADALERPDLVPPGTRTLNMSQLGRVLTDATLAPPVKALFVYNSNPAAVAPEQDAVRRGLAREDLFVVVHEQFQTDTADFADILLPATGWGEKDGTVTNSERRISRQRAFMAPPGEARPDWWILTQVARRLGHGAAFPYDSAAEIFREHASLTALDNGGTRDLDLGGLTGLSDADYEVLTPIQWPVPAGEMPAPLRRARALAYLLERKAICILDGELIVGEKGPAPKATPTYPELCCHTLSDLDILDSRAKIPFKVSPETREVYEKQIIPFWLAWPPSMPVGLLK